MTSSPDIILPPRHRVRVGLGAGLVLLVLGVAVAVLVAALGPHGQTSRVVSPSTTSPSSGHGAETIYVHVLGAVAHPGLFTLKDGDRLVDAVAAAGGFSSEADQTQLNLARPLSDGEQIAVPVIGAAAPVPSAGGGNASGGKVNLNTADETALETLPRVGPAMAARIIAWRTQNGRFSSVEDLLSVTGVGDKTFAELKDLVTV